MQTLRCTYLSAVLLLSLVLSATLGWWWADPVAALIIAAVALREGVETWLGEGCCSPSAAAAAGTGEEHGDAGRATLCCENGQE